MNRLHFLPVFGVLIVCLIAAWAHRFAPADGAARIGMDALQKIGPPSAQIRFDERGLGISARPNEPASESFFIPGVGSPDHLFLRYHGVAHGIRSGSQRWEDGRLFVEWINEGRRVGISAIHSARDDQDSGGRVVVVSSPRKGAVPVLRLQNLGTSGTFEIRKLEIVAARERRVWAWGKWGIAAAFLGAVAAMVGGTKKPARWRGWVAAGVWLVVAAGYAFPGPWDAARPFVVPFSFVEVPAAGPADVTAKAAAGWLAESIDAPTVERLPPPSDLGLRLKVGLPWLRPLLHVVLLFTPVLVMAWLVGGRRAFWLGWALSLSIEAGQLLYGFGFGWDDVGDLLINGLAISAAVWAHRKFSRRLHGLLPFRFPEPG
ncbi:MAG: hypothetical protein ACNA8L_08355 [Luteolibacter sp.]